MRYSINYQLLPKGELGPRDDGTTIDIDTGKTDEQVILPNVGDYVNLDNSGTDKTSLNGRVRSRAFFYAGDGYCHINIVVEETEGEEWSKLIKE
jgi:FAD/FMN-containing dehydrogenase